MFYYPSVLQRHTGCFATIWLAATGGTRLMKREYLKVNVPQTCDEIMDFILVRVPPPMRGAPRPRFSLYLSAQLQYGVVLVYSRQCQYLVEEIQQILDRLNRTQQQMRIDLTDLEQPGLLLPNQLELMESLEEAPDPFFGMMVPLLPSPIEIPYVRSILEAPTPERSPPELSLSPPLRRAGEPLLTAFPESITLKEAEPITLLRIEDEQDLPEITAREIDMLAEQEGFLVPGVEKPLESPHVSARKRRLEEELVEEAREQEPLISLGLSPPTWIREKTSAAGETGSLSVGEVQLPGEAPLLPLEMTPPSEGSRLLPPLPPSSPTSSHLERRPPSSPELLLPEFEPSPARPRRRRRQLRFLDEVTQISREDFQEQIMNTQTQCQPLEMVLLPAKRQRTPAELFGNPTYELMHPSLRALWTHCANLQRVDYARQRAAEAQAQWAEEESLQRTEVLSRLEELRAVEEPSLVPPAGSSEISLETTEEEQRPSLAISEDRPLLESEEVALPAVPELPEVSFELPLDKDTITLDYVRRLISAKLEQVGEIEFDHLVPLTTPRPIVSQFFYMCLVLAGAQFLRLEQSEPYGRILLQPGARSHLS